MYFYSETNNGPKSDINVWKMNGTKQYLRHYDNYLFLHFVAKNMRATEAERNQARGELPLCEKKLEFWRRHPNYDHNEVLRGVAALKKNWSAPA